MGEYPDWCAPGRSQLEQGLALGCAGAHELSAYGDVLRPNLLLGIGIHETCNSALGRIPDLPLFVSSRVCRQPGEQGLKKQVGLAPLWIRWDHGLLLPNLPR